MFFNNILKTRQYEYDYKASITHTADIDDVNMEKFIPLILLLAESRVSTISSRLWHRTKGVLTIQIF